MIGLSRADTSAAIPSCTIAADINDSSEQGVKSQDSIFAQADMPLQSSMGQDVKYALVSVAAHKGPTPGAGRWMVWRLS